LTCVDTEAADVTPEDFESGWDNDVYLTELPFSATAAADLTPEDFETGWDNVPYYTEWSSVPQDRALWDTANQDFEDFEEEWKDNENYMFTWGDVTAVAALFDTAPVPYEDFENEWTTTMVTFP
jgi:hypothetical protein